LEMKCGVVASHAETQVDANAGFDK